MKAEDQVLDEFQKLERLVVSKRKDKEEARNKLKTIFLKLYKKGKSIGQNAEELELDEDEVRSFIDGH